MTQFIPQQGKLYIPDLDEITCFRADRNHPISTHAISRSLIVWDKQAAPAGNDPLIKKGAWTYWSPELVGMCISDGETAISRELDKDHRHYNVDRAIIAEMMGHEMLMTDGRILFIDSQSCHLIKRVQQQPCSKQ